MPTVILDDYESASYLHAGHTFLITGAQIRQRARKHRDPIAVSTTAVIGITEDDRPFLSWKDGD